MPFMKHALPLLRSTDLFMLSYAMNIMYEWVYFQVLRFY